MTGAHSTAPSSALHGAIRGRRSLRGLAGPPLTREEVEALVALALTAPAPHHTRPWRFAHVGPSARAGLARAMGEAWQADMQRDGVDPGQRARALERSRRQLEEAPTLLIGALVGEGLRAWPDERRLRSEWMMAAHSFGAALENLLLAASTSGLAAFWISAPLFAPGAVCESLSLPGDWVPQAAVALGRPRSDYRPFDRPAPDVAGSLLWR